MNITLIQYIKLTVCFVGVMLVFSNMYFRFSDKFELSIGRPEKITGGEKLKFAYQFPLWRPFINIKIRM